MQSIEAKAASRWFNDRPTIIGGDFNMPEDDFVYEQYFGHLNNSLSEEFFTLKSTYFYRAWYGIRIDHLLHSDDFTTKESRVLQDFGGEHRPVLAVLKLKN